MKYSIPLFFVILFGCDSKELSLILTNSSEKVLINQPIAVSRDDLGVSPEEFLILTNINGQVIPVQHDDLNDDDKWDELSFLLDFQSREELEISYRIVLKSDLPEFETRTDVYLGHSPNRDKTFTPVMEHIRPKDHIAQSQPFLYQYEGPGWETELVGFRAYFDSRNGKDIFGKTKPQLISDQIGTGDNYHQLQGWGMDVLKVGNSLGAGAIALLKGDSLYRITNVKKASFAKVVSGPVRSIMRLSYEGWPVANSSYDLTETITVWAGKRNYESSINLSSDNKSDTLVTGIVNLKNLTASKISTANAQILYTHGKQSENKDVMGMGLIIPRNGSFGFGEAPNEGSGVTNTYTAFLRNQDGAYRFSFYVGWELESSDFAEESFFAESLRNLTTSFNNAVTVKKLSK